MNWRHPGVVDLPKLIGFTEGSLMAYGCSVNVRWKIQKMMENDPDKFLLRLVGSKVLVTILRGDTAPKSEISGFLILTRLLKIAINTMDVKPSRVLFGFNKSVHHKQPRENWCPTLPLFHQSCIGGYKI